MKTLKEIIFDNTKTREATTDKKRNAYADYEAVIDMANEAYDDACENFENAKTAAADKLNETLDADYVDAANIKQAEEDFQKICEKAQADFAKAQQTYMDTVMAAEAELLQKRKDTEEKDVEKGIEYLTSDKGKKDAEIWEQINKINDMLARYEDGGNPDNLTKKDVAILTEEANYWYSELYGSVVVTIAVTGIAEDQETGEVIREEEVVLPINYYVYPSNTLLGQFASYMLTDLLDKMAETSMYPDDVMVAMLVRGQTVRAIQFTDYCKMMALLM